MNKHTPGPEVRDCQPDIDRIEPTQANNQPNCKAAAQLSDAAPDMLEALQHIGSTD